MKRMVCAHAAVCPLCVVGQGVGKHFDEVYTKMLEYAREHDIESTKRKPERFPSAIGEILQQVLGTDYDILNPQADEPIKIERGALTNLVAANVQELIDFVWHALLSPEYLFVMFLCSYVEVYGQRAIFRYRNVEDMCAVNASYESFKERTSVSGTNNTNSVLSCIHCQRLINRGALVDWCCNVTG